MPDKTIGLAVPVVLAIWKYPVALGNLAISMENQTVEDTRVVLPLHFPLRVLTYTVRHSSTMFVLIKTV